jgi:hypothetical protein
MQEGGEPAEIVAKTLDIFERVAEKAANEVSAHICVSEF